GQKVFVQNGEARLADGTLAGSVLRMNRAVENLVKKVGVPFLRAVDCATINPARNLGIDKQAGSIALGKNADFTVLDGNYDVVCTVRGGNIVYARR
ncbi:MAG: amidohydrolase family protein, partial [Clostridia bacterium]|nr:amidohydrolase family protein [Clostridia bacterium]